MHGNTHNPTQLEQNIIQSLVTKWGYILGIGSYVKEKNTGGKRKESDVSLVHMWATHGLRLPTSRQHTADSLPMSEGEEVQN